MVISIFSISMLAGLIVLGGMVIRAVSAAKRRVAPIKLPVQDEQIRR